MSASGPGAARAALERVTRALAITAHRLAAAIAEASAKAVRANDDAAAAYVLGRRARWKPADVPLVHKAFVRRGMPPEVVRAVLEALQKGRGRPTLDELKAAGPLAELVHWGDLPEGTPAQRRRKLLEYPGWGMLVAEAYAGELERVRSEPPPLNRSLSEQAIANVAEVFCVSEAVIRKAKQGVAAAAGPPNPTILAHWRRFIETGDDAAGAK